MAGCLLAGILLAGHAARAATPACTVTFTGKVSDQWSNPANWSTGAVPGPSSDVCITKAALQEPVATGKIDIHSLQVEAGTNVTLGGVGPTLPIRTASVTISDVLIDTSDSFVLLDGSLKASAIDNPGQLVAGPGPCSKPPRVVCRGTTITSPALSSTGTIEALNGTLRLTDNPVQLHDGTFNGGTLDVSPGPLGHAIILDGNISSNAAGTIHLEAGGNASIENETGGNALASLSSIGQNATLIDESSLTVNGSLVSQGRIQLALDLAIQVAGELNVRGDFTQTSSGTLVEALAPDLSVGRTATLSGNLDIGVRRTCTPKDGTTATEMTFAARSGEFTTTSSGFNVRYGATSVQAQYEGPENMTGCGPGG